MDQAIGVGIGLFVAVLILTACVVAMVLALKK